MVSSLKSSVEYWQYQNSKIQQENAALELRLQAQSKMAQLSIAVNEFLNSEKERLQKRVMELDLMNKKLTTLNGPVSNSNRLSPQPITNMGLSSSILIHQRIQPMVEIGRNPDPSKAEEHKVELSNLSDGPRSLLPEPCSTFGSELDLPPETEHLKLDLPDREEFDMDLFNLLNSPGSYAMEPTSIPGPCHDLLAGLSSHAIEPTSENGPTRDLPQGEESDTEWLTWLLD
ncbi:hypothetical protein Nepgr_012795 [Nepenthes gracilis]|uniref:Uncharacterized protein n=1 Tax=Nepenthes gracilis TaxID=150966 RepID=A0AAD3SHY1_NEPGR|nr:hypothetical protein Nepgr_012795 [Nepenthes gracilis]